MEKKGYGKMLAGVGIGIGLGLLFAPRKGVETRKILKDKFDYLVEKVKNIDIEEVKEDFTKKIEELKLEIASLDKEKVLEVAKEKSDMIKKKVDELAHLAKKKATPVVEKAVDEVRVSLIHVTKDVLKKLETSKSNENQD